MTAPEKERVQKSPVSFSINSPENCIIIADHVEVHLVYGARARREPGQEPGADTPAGK
jgi:hypothetical protein